MRTDFARRLQVSLLLLAVLAAPALARAQAATPAAAPAETVKAVPVTKGTTDVSRSGFASAAALKADDPTHLNELELAAGGLFASGNARTVAITSAAKLKLRREAHQFSSALSANYARAGKRDAAADTTVENLQGLLRYDYFFIKNMSLFLQSSARRDRFQGLDVRLNVDPGVSYYFIQTATHRLNAELGYDLQHDVRRDTSLAVAPPASAPPGTPPTTLDKTQTLHNVRAFLGYENKLYDKVSFTMSLEYLQNLADPQTYRLIFDTGLKTHVAERLAISTTYTMRYENRPLPAVETTDSLASVNLVYSFF